MTSVTASFRPSRSCLARCLVLLCGVAVFALGSPAYSQTVVKPFVMATDAEPGSMVHRWVVLAYTEVFKRLGMPVEIVNYSLARREALVEGGRIDGEVSRIYSYADSHPDLIRIEEPIMDFTFSVFTGNPAVNARRLEDIASGKLVAEYRRGILMCENSLKKFVPAERLTDVPSSDQGVKKVQTGRTDIYCDIDLYVRQALNSPELNASTNVRKLFNIASVPTYPYLNRRHAELAPRMANVLKQMKAEGLLEAYPAQAARELGWTR